MYVWFQDTFFYSLVYDPSQRTLLADKGEIRVGSRFQAESLPYVLPGKFRRFKICLVGSFTGLSILYLKIYRYYMDYSVNSFTNEICKKESILSKQFKKLIQIL